MKPFDLSEFSDEEVQAIANSIKQNKDIRAFNATCLSAHFDITPISSFHDHLFDSFVTTIHTNAREATAGPRGFGKTSVVSCSIPLFSTCLELYKFIVLGADTAGQAEDYLDVVKDELENNENLAELYPDVVGVGKVWRKDKIITRNDVCILALGTGGKIRGRKYKKWRPQLVILDDIYNLSHKYSPTLSIQLEEWVFNDVLKCGAPGKPLDIFFVGTVLGRACLLYKLINGDEFPIWNSALFKAFKSFPANMDFWEKWGDIFRNKKNPNRIKECKKFYIQNRVKMDEGAEVLWPATSKTPVYSLMSEYYGEGRRSFLLEKQNEPIIEGEKTFDLGAYRFYDEKEWEEVPKNEILFYAYLDATLGDKKSHKKHNPDLYAFTILGKWLKFNLFYVVESICGCKPPSYQYEVAYKLMVKYPIFRFYVESMSFQDLIFQGLKEKFKSLGASKVPRRFITTIAKQAREESIEPYLANHTIILSHKHVELINELEDHPDCDKHDAIDSLAGCFGSAYKAYKFRSYHNK